MSAATLELPTPQQIDDERKDLWDVKRQKHLTGTDIAAVFGLSKFKGPIDVWLHKKGLSVQTDNDAMEFGRRFERPILEVYSERLSQPIEFADHWTLYEVPDCPLLGASLDARWLNGDRRPVDAKNTRYKTDKWGDTGSDVFPIHYQLQMAVQMMATETQVADLAVCFGGNEFARYTLHRDAETDEAIIARAYEWWEKHVIADIPPEPDGSESYGNFLKTRFQRASEITVPVTIEVREWVAARAEAKARMDAAESDANVAEQAIKAYMGDAQAIPGVCTWKNNKSSFKTDWQAAFGDLRSYVLDPEIQKLSTPLDAVSNAVDSNTSDIPGPRVFRLAK